MQHLQFHTILKPTGPAGCSARPRHEIDAVLKEPIAGPSTSDYLDFRETAATTQAQTGRKRRKVDDVKFAEKDGREKRLALGHAYHGWKH